MTADTASQPLPFSAHSLPFLQLLSLYSYFEFLSLPPPPSSISLLPISFTFFSAFSLNFCSPSCCSESKLWTRVFNSDQVRDGWTKTRNR
jgi:hypothetical protein